MTAIRFFTDEDLCGACTAVWLRQGRHHSGILLSNQRAPGDLLRRLLALANTVDAEAMRDRLEYLSDW